MGLLSIRNIHVDIISAFQQSTLAETIEDVITEYQICPEVTNYTVRPMLYIISFTTYTCNLYN